MSAYSPWTACDKAIFRDQPGAVTRLNGLFLSPVLVSTKEENSQPFLSQSPCQILTIINLHRNRATKYDFSLRTEIRQTSAPPKKQNQKNDYCWFNHPPQLFQSCLPKVSKAGYTPVEPSPHLTSTKHSPPLKEACNAVGC